MVKVDSRYGNTPGNSYTTDDEFLTVNVNSRYGNTPVSTESKYSSTAWLPIRWKCRSGWLCLSALYYRTTALPFVYKNEKLNVMSSCLIHLFALNISLELNMIIQINLHNVSFVCSYEYSWTFIHDLPTILLFLNVFCKSHTKSCASFHF